MATTRRTFLQAAAGLGLAPWPAQAEALTKVRYVSSSPVARPYHAYIYAGARAGLHTKIGVDPEFLFIAGSGAVLQLLISGDGDIGNIGILEFIATKKNQPTLLQEAERLCGWGEHKQVGRVCVTVPGT